MEVLGQFHPQIVHTPIVMLIFSALFALIGRLFDRDWLRKAAMVMLVVGALGAFIAMRSGFVAHRVPEREQGVPEQAIDEHAGKALLTFRLAIASLLAYAIATRFKGGAKAAVQMLALLLQLGAAVAVGVTGRKGAELVFEHGANVRIGGALVKHPGAGLVHASDADSTAER